MDNPLGYSVAGRGLGAEQEGVGHQIHVGVIPQHLVEVDDVHGVEELPLVLMEALDLHVENGVGIEDDPLLLLGVGSEVLLVRLFDLLQLLQHRLIFSIGIQLLKGIGMEQVVLTPSKITNQAV